MRRSVSLLSLTLAASLVSAGCESETSTTPDDKAAGGAPAAPTVRQGDMAKANNTKAKPITERRKLVGGATPKSL
jgi:hypothetical protein